MHLPEQACAFLLPPYVFLQLERAEVNVVVGEEFVQALAPCLVETYDDVKRLFQQSRLLIFDQCISFHDHVLIVYITNPRVCRWYTAAV